jgi:putative transposase
MIEPKNSDIPISIQCKLIDLKRTSYYYKPKQKIYDDKLLKEILNIYEETPFYGYRKVTKQLQEIGFNIGRKEVRKLRGMLGLKTKYQKPKTTQREPSHEVYPYLLRDMEIDKVNQVWSTDITYIPTSKGFIYLTAVIDWYSKKILSYRVSNSMDKSFCIEALNEALRLYPKPKIFNTDQGSQYTSKEFTQILKDNKIKISMDGKGRATDNIAIERFWRTIKYEELYINEYKNVKEIKKAISEYIEFYNKRRFHETLDYLTPDKFYYQNLQKDKSYAVILEQNISSI